MDEIKNVSLVACASARAGVLFNRGMLTLFPDERFSGYSGAVRKIPLSKVVIRRRCLPASELPYGVL
jgi:hypothetical protein